MSYSQKYCLVSFIQPCADGTEFNMTDWPLHLTLADAFSINLKSTRIESKLAKLLSNKQAFTILADKETILGNTKVMLINNCDDLSALHNHVVDLLETNGATFNTPKFVRDGFLPHCTVQKSARLYLGDEIKVHSVALIDMFPDQNWQQRKVIRTYKLKP